MDSPQFTTRMHHFVPDQFMPAIGLVVVQHAEMDAALGSAISVLAGMDYNTGTSILSKVQTTAGRAEIFQNLARTKATDLPRLAKMLVLADIVIGLCQERNTVAHSLPYAWNPSKGELTYFKEVNKTYPQIKIKPPYLATIKSLFDLADRMRVAATWLGMLRPMWKSNAADPNEPAKHHPSWDDDAQFPWPDKLQKKIQSESDKPLSAAQIGRKFPPGPDET